MHIPSRVEVLSWNENQVADLLREHKLNDCVDCVFQRHIDGQKLLNLKEGEVLHFLEIHNYKSRGRFWNIVKQVTEKKEKKGGVHSLMSKFQETPQWSNNAEEEEEEDVSCDYSDDSFDSDDYDEPDPEPDGTPAISLERRETIKNNLLMSLMSQAAAPPVNNEEDYPSEDIYDVPEDGCGEPEEDVYDVPSDESGGGIVGRRPPLERKESDQYLMPDQRKLFDHSQTADEEDYEDLNGVPPSMGRSDIEEQEDYVVPDTKPAVVVPPRPPKSSTGKKPLPPPAENGHKEPKAEKKNAIKKLTSMFQQQENYEPPQPQRGLKKKSESPKPPPKAPAKVSPKPLHFAKKIEKKPPGRPAELDPEEMYEPPDQPQRFPNKSAVKPPVEIEQENYEAPDTPVRPPAKPAKKAAVKPPVEIEQENYEAPDTPVRPPTKQAKKAAVKPPIEIEQENYEAPDTPVRPTKKPLPVMKPAPVIPEQENYEPPELQRKSKPVPIMDPEENYEDPNQIAGGMNESDGDEFEQEDYEIPDRSDAPAKATPEVPKKLKKGLFGRSPSKKTPKPPGKADKKKTTKTEVPVPPKAVPPVPNGKQPPTPPVTAGKSILNKFRGDKSAEKRNSMALPSIPIDNVDSKSDFPSPPPKPPFQKEKPVSNQRHNMPDLPPSGPPKKNKQELLEDQPWFHGLISKKEVVDILKNAKKDGAYLVRKSSRDPDKCIMSISYKNDIRHLNIPCDEKGHYRLGDSGVERFKNIEELVTYFNKHDVEFSAGGKTPLTHACMKSS